MLEPEELLLKFIRKNEEPRIARLIFKKMKKGRLTLLHIVIKTTRFGAGIDKKTTGMKKIRYLGTY